MGDDLSVFEPFRSLHCTVEWACGHLGATVLMHDGFGSFDYTKDTIGWGRRQPRTLELCDATIQMGCGWPFTSRPEGFFKSKENNQPSYDLGQRLLDIGFSHSATIGL